ncbi:MAG: hypothetical protein U0640_08510 [Phycisphaerales bacterium]
MAQPMAQTLQNKTSSKSASGDTQKKNGQAAHGADGSLARGVALELEETRGENGVAPSVAMPPAVNDGSTSRDQLDMTLDQAIDRAFLSPRVVDQATFDWLAGSLKKLTTEAAMQHRSLSATTTQATTVQTQLQEQLRGLVKDLQGRVDAALKAIPALEARAGRAQALLDRVTNETALSKAREVRDAVIAEVVKQRDSIVTEAVQKALEGAIETAKAKFEKDCAEMVRNALEQARADAILAARAVGAELANTTTHSAVDAHRATDRGGALTVGGRTSEDSRTFVSLHAPSTDKQSLVGGTEVDEHAAQLRALMAKQQELAAQLISIEDRARTLLFEFDGGAEQSEARIAAVQQATEAALVRAEQGEKSLEEAVLRAQMRFQQASTEAERRTEAVATEISEQLQALRHDAATIAKDAQATLQTNAREQEERLTRVFDGYATRIQTAQSQIEQMQAQHAQTMLLQSVEQHGRETASTMHVADASAQHVTQLQNAIASANEAIAKLEAARDATAVACRTCDEKSHALVHLMDHVEGRMAEIQTKSASEEFAAGKAMNAATVGSPVTSTPIAQTNSTTSGTEDLQRQAMMVSQQLYQLTGQAVQVGQWLSGMLQQVMQQSARRG